MTTMSEEKMTLQEAVAYLQPIADSAVVGHYGALDHLSIRPEVQ